jgi:pyrimidine deaminase RibD-like protein
MNWSAEELEHMRRAIELAARSVEEPGRTRPSPKVGALLVRDGVTLGRGIEAQPARDTMLNTVS